MIFTTESGSVYEVVDNKVRRLSGDKNPTPRIGTDGEWKKALSVSEPTVGLPVFITWENDIQPAPIFGTIPATLTSKVISINKEFN
jgi:hypothetical protein